MAKGTKPRDEKCIATFRMVVTYESVPTDTELQELIEKAQEYGGVDVAEFTIHRSVTRSLV